MLGVYVSGKSGGHINPAVTFASCVFRGHPWRKFPVYAVAQILGAMVGAAIVYGNYKSAFDVFEGGVGLRTVGGPNSTAGVFCTYPASFMTRTGMFFSEFIASSILQFVLFALADADNIGAGPLLPLCLFFLIFGIGACFGWETGYAINLARDFGPRLVSYMIGYGSDVFSAGGYYFWVSKPLCCRREPRLTREADPHGGSLLRLPGRRCSVRHLHLHRREPHEHALPRIDPPVQAQAQRVVQHSKPRARGVDKHWPRGFDKSAGRTRRGAKTAKVESRGRVEAGPERLRTVLGIFLDSWPVFLDTAVRGHFLEPAFLMSG